MPPHRVSGIGATIMIGMAHDHVKKKLNSNIRTHKIMTGSGEVFRELVMKWQMTDFFLKHCKKQELKQILVHLILIALFTITRVETTQVSIGS